MSNGNKDIDTPEAKIAFSSPMPLIFALSFPPGVFSKEPEEDEEDLG